MVCNGVEQVYLNLCQIIKAIVEYPAKLFEKIRRWNLFGNRNVQIWIVPDSWVLAAGKERLEKTEQIGNLFTIFAIEVSFIKRIKDPGRLHHAVFQVAEGLP